MTIEFFAGFTIATIVWGVIGFGLLLRWFYRTGSWIAEDVRRMTRTVTQHIQSAQIAVGNDDAAWARRCLDHAVETITEFHALSATEGEDV